MTTFFSIRHSNEFTITVTYSLSTSTNIGTPFIPDIDFPINSSTLPIDLINQGYISPANNIESDNVSIKEKAIEITQYCYDQKGAVEALATWIAANINYDSSVSKKSSDVFSSRLGDCEGQSNLMIAFCRSLSIPARIAVGASFPYETKLPLWGSGSFLTSDAGKTGTVTNASIGHAVYEVYYLKENSGGAAPGWIRGDPAMHTCNFGWSTFIKKASGVLC
jgi:hypothetical protein